MKIFILGGTGYAGSAIAAETARRGHDVTVIARKTPPRLIDGVSYLTADLTDTGSLSSLMSGAEVIISTLSPRGDMANKLFPTVKEVAAWASQIDARFISMGGFSSLRMGDDGPRIVSVGRFPDALQTVVNEMAEVVDWLESSAPKGLRWLYISPAQGFGSYSDTKPTGHYEIGGNTMEVENSVLAVEDLALAVADEVECDEHSGHISIRN